MAKIKFALTTFFCFLIKIYQLCLSHLLPQSCRFYPSCSHYALEAFEKKGPFFGLYLTLKRICHCHPWHPGGYDPVEPT